MTKTDKTHFLVSPGRLRRQDNNLYFDRYDEDGNTIGTKILPINALENLYVFAKVDIDTYTMAFLSSSNVLLHCFSQAQSYRGSFFPNSPNSVNKSGFVLLQQLRAFDDEKHRLHLACAITQARIENAVKNCEDYEVTLDKERHLEALEKVGSIGQVMAVEGAFQKQYYQAWNSIIKNQKSFKFTTRSKRPPADKLNCLISYVNTRIYSICLSEIYKTELDPRIGFLHEPNYRSLSLHLDLAEIFKPLIGDRLIFSLLNNEQITAKSFQSDAGRLRFKKEALQTLETEMIKRLGTPVKDSALKKTMMWREIIRREANQIKRSICEYSDYKGFERHD